jgi:hypothetical protein
MWRGDSHTITIPVLDGDGANVNLTGATARWWMGRSATSTGTNVYIQKATGGDGITITSSSGLYTLNITLEPEDTEDLRAGEWYHEAEVVDSSGNVATVTVGTFTLEADLVRS